MSPFCRWLHRASGWPHVESLEHDATQALTAEVERQTADALAALKVLRKQAERLELRYDK